MVDTVVGIVIGSVILAGSAVGLGSAVYRRFRGTTDFGKWQGGGQVTFTGHMATMVFFASIGATFLQMSAIWAIPALAAWIVGFISQNRANRRHHDEEEALRLHNAVDHPGIFFRPPPDDMDDVPGEWLDLYDAGACTFLGVVQKSDVRSLLEVFPDLFDEGPNDFFFIPEMLEIVPESRLSPKFAELLNRSLAERDYLVLRWMPSSRNPD